LAVGAQMRYDGAMRYLLPLLMVTASCGIPVTPTPGDVALIEGDRLRACTIHLGWTPAVLRAYCGEPEQIVAWAGHDGSGECYLYRTSAQSFSGWPAAPRLAACVDHALSADSGRMIHDPDEPRVVITVYALREP
jgi:hypothetical protein